MVKTRKDGLLSFLLTFLVFSLLLYTFYQFFYFESIFLLISVALAGSLLSASLNMLLIYRKRQAVGENNFLLKAMGAAINVSHTTEAISEMARNSLDRVKKIAASLEEINSGIDSTSGKINDISREAETFASVMSGIASDSSKVSSETETMCRLVEQGVGRVLEATENMGEIVNFITETVNQTERLFTEISGMVDSISDIASQTNMLALNAAIESARAGEQGRGFAVVAAEVKKLADESSKLAGIINAKINEMQSAVKKSVSHMVNVENNMQSSSEATREAKDNLKAINEAVNQVSKLSAGIFSRIKQNAERSAEIAVNIENISRILTNNAKIVSDINSITSEEASSIEDNANAINELNTQAKVLHSMTDDFDRKLGREMLEVAHRVADIIHRKRMNNEQIKKLAEKAGISEIYVAGPDRKICLTSHVATIGFKFDDTAGSQTAPFVPIIDGKIREYAQETCKRQFDQALVKIVGVQRRGEPGLVQICINSDDLSKFDKDRCIRILKSF
ncbi:MAG: methyl-accepting chemotaxis protein [Bacillota bacterium]